MRHGVSRGCWLAFCIVLTTSGLCTQAQPAGASRTLAPGFSQLPAAARVVVVPFDVELSAISAGGVQEPRADWTEAASRHVQAALEAHRGLLGPNASMLDTAGFDEFGEISTLHRAVAQSVFVHHVMTNVPLPAKRDRLDWSMGDAVRPLQVRSGADYALFVWVRDSYASSARNASIVMMAIIGGLGPGMNFSRGSQLAHASLVDLHTGRIVWFNGLKRSSGDLREAQPARETVEALLEGFPARP